MIKKLISAFMAMTMMLSFTACSDSNLTEEEKAVIGLWNGTAVMIGEEVQALPSAYCALEIREDHTATSSIMNSETGGSDKGEMTWEYSGVEEELHIFNMTNSEGGKITAAYSPRDNWLFVMSGPESSILFEKVS